MAKSAIGKYLYYVHYYGSNYYDPPSNQYFSEYARTRVRNASNSLHTKVSNAKKQEFAQLISVLFGKADLEKAGEYKSQIPIVRKVVEQLLNANVKEFVNQKGIIEPTGRIVSGIPASKVESGGRASDLNRYFSREQLMDLERSLKTRVVLINKTLNKAERGSVEYQELEELKSNIKLMLDEINRFKQIQDTDLKTLKEWSPSLFGANIDNTERINLSKYLRPGSKRKTDYTLLRDINQMLKKYHINDDTLNAATGFYGEAVVAGIAQLFFKISTQTIGDNIVERMKGSESSAIKYQINGVPQEVISKLKLDIKEQHISPGGVKTLVTSHASQQKIDVVVDFPVSESLTIRNIGTSVKNVNLRRAIGIVSGTNLWYLLHNEDPKRFFRHWLNVMAEHNALKEKFLNTNNEKMIKKMAKESVSISKIKSHREDAIFAAKLIAGYKALTGDVFDRTAAKLFVVNDTSSISGKVYVLEMNDILKAILLATLEGSSIDKYFIFDHTVDFDNLYIKNQWDEDSLHNRMANLLNDLHAKKIYVSLSNSVLDKNFIKRAGGSFITA